MIRSKPHNTPRTGLVCRVPPTPVGLRSWRRTWTEPGASVRKAVAALGLIGTLLLMLSPVISEGAPPPDIPVVGARGDISVPERYRTAYEFMGTWAVASDEAKGSKEVHTVFASPGTAAAYRQTGKFPDNSVLVKEVADVMTESMTTGTVSHPTKLKGWFVMVKDEKGRFPDNKLWGDGWGWSWFDVDKPSQSTSVAYRTDCQGCHVPAKKTDWIYIHGYSPLAR